MKNFKLISIPCLVALLGITGSFSLPGEAKAQNAGTRAPQTAAPANIARVNLTLERQPNESYDILIRRAEAAARNTTVQTFNQNRAVGAVVVTIIGQNGGAIAPLLSVQVNRQNWASVPDTQRWATYFKSASTLLGLGTPGGNVANQPANQPAGQVPANGNANGNVNATNGTTTPNNSGIQVLPNGTVVTENGATQVFSNDTTAPSNAAGVSPNGIATPNNNLGNGTFTNTPGNNNLNNATGSNGNLTPNGQFGGNSNFNNNDTNGNLTPNGQFGGNSNFNNTGNNSNFNGQGNR